MLVYKKRLTVFHNKIFPTSLTYFTIAFDAEIISSNSFGLTGNDDKVVVASGCFDGEGFL
jgi:hypothetical protein